jgi:hypothetical protein
MGLLLACVGRMFFTKMKMNSSCLFTDHSLPIHCLWFALLSTLPLIVQCLFVYVCVYVCMCVWWWW